MHRTPSQAALQRKQSIRDRIAERVFAVLRKRGDELSASDIVRATRGLTDYAVRLALASLEATGRIESRKVLRPYKSVNTLTTVYRPVGAPLRLDWGQPSDRGDEIHRGLGVKDQKEIEARIETERKKKIEEDEKTFWKRIDQIEWVGPRGRDHSLDGRQRQRGR